MSSSDTNSDNIKITPYIPLLSICMMGMFLAIRQPDRTQCGHPPYNQ